MSKFASSSQPSSSQPSSSQPSSSTRAASRQLEPESDSAAERVRPSPHPRLDEVLARTEGRGDAQAVYEPAFCTEVVCVMGEGFSLTAFAGAINASRKTLDAWVAAHPDFAAAVERGRAARTRALEIQFLTAGTGAKVAAHVFALRNAAPEDWRERPDADAKVLPNITFVLNGQDGDPDLPRLETSRLETSRLETPGLITPNLVTPNLVTPGLLTLRSEDGQ